MTDIASKLEPRRTRMNQAQFSIGQVVVHKKFNYRGVIYDVDAEYSGTDQWYEEVAKSRPPKDRPWYHVLVDGQLMTTYVAEQHLELDDLPTPITHPLTENYFDTFEGGLYRNYRYSN